MQPTYVDNDPNICDYSFMKDAVYKEPSLEEKLKMLSVLEIDCSAIDTRSFIDTYTTITSTQPMLAVDGVYERAHKLEPMTCHNCGGRIDITDLTCCFCGTHYR